MSNPQQQQGKQETKAPSAFAPDKFTVFLLQCDVGPEFEGRVRAALRRRFPSTAAYRVESQMNHRRLTDGHTVVGVYQDPDGEIADASVEGGFRPRRLDLREGGKVTQKAELPEIKLTEPIRCDRFWADGSDNDGSVKLQNWTEHHADGRRTERYGFLTVLTRAMTSADGRMVARACFSDRDAAPDAFISIRGA